MSSPEGVKKMGELLSKHTIVILAGPQTIPTPAIVNNEPVIQNVYSFEEKERLSKGELKDTLSSLEDLGFELNKKLIVNGTSHSVIAKP